jgi:uncharacterized membrane protein YidH (DUF202 family)
LNLPNSRHTRIEREKITSYLLSTCSSGGRSKAKFFSGFGFRIEQWQIFADALRVHGASHEVLRTTETSYGTKYIINGSLETPDGRNPYVRTVWQIDKGNDYPRFITAYPAD